MATSTEVYTNVYLRGNNGRDHRASLDEQQLRAKRNDGVDCLSTPMQIVKQIKR